MLVNICDDIQFFKKQLNETNIKNYDSTSEGSNKSTLADLQELLKYIEGINNDVINNKKLLKNVLEEDYENKKKCINKIKKMINLYVEFYDYVDEIRLYFEELGSCENKDIINILNDILKFLEKEYLGIGFTIYKPKVGIDKFDKCKHELVKTEKNSDLPKDTIIYVNKKGFYYNDRNIRYIRTAKVITVLN